MLTESQIAFYNENGYLHIPQVFSPQMVKAMRDDLNWMIEVWANREAGWSGPWRKKYMDEETEKKSKLVAVHDLQLYSRAWLEGVTQRDLCAMMSQLLGGGPGTPVELHHTTMHVKPPETGHPFPLHQDWWFYMHADVRFIDVLVHLDDTCHANGEIRFMPGSHKLGVIEHVTRTEEGKGCTPHLPVDQWPLANTVAVPAKAGDVVLFNILTVHGSYINTTKDDRRMVRVGYRHPDNEQLAGQSHGRPGILVHGKRERRAGMNAFPCEPANCNPNPSRPWREQVNKAIHA